MSDIEYVMVMHDGNRSTKFMSEDYCKDLMEQLAFAQSQEVCAVAHDNVETCGYCQRDALAARLAEAEREADLYHKAMEALRSTKMKHGLCQPRERMACTHCNAVDKLDAMLIAYKGRRIVASFAGAAVSASACLGGAPHWWDINAVTGQSECRLCHESPDPSAKESL